MFSRFFGLFGALAAFCTAWAGEVRIPVLASSDLHGNSAVIEAGVIPALAQIEAQGGVKPIYCDLGDVAEGSLGAMRSRGAGFIRELNRANAAAWVPGNHDVSFGLAPFADAMREFQGAVLAANLHFPEAGDSFKPFVIVERGGCRIALIGMMLKNMNSSVPVPESRFQTAAALDTLPSVMDEVRKSHPDAVILLRHAGVYGGGENLADVLAAAPGIDLVIGGHTHTAEAGRMVRASWFIQPGANGENLALATLVFDDKTHKLKQIESRFVELPEVSVKNPELTEPAPALVGEKDNFAAKRMMESLDADAAIYAVGNPAAWRKLQVNPSPTVGDYFEVFPYFDPVLCVEVSAVELKAIVQEYALFVRERKGFLALAGGTYSLKNGKLDRFQLERNLPKYRLAVTAYAAAGAGGRLPATRAILKNRVTSEALESAVPLLDLMLSD